MLRDESLRLVRFLSTWLLRFMLYYGSVPSVDLYCPSPLLLTGTAPSPCSHSPRASSENQSCPKLIKESQFLIQLSHVCASATSSPGERVNRTAAWDLHLIWATVWFRAVMDWSSQKIPHNHSSVLCDRTQSLYPCTELSFLIRRRHGLTLFQLKAGTPGHFHSRWSDLISC